MIEKNSMREAMVFFDRKTSDSLKVDRSLVVKQLHAHAAALKKFGGGRLIAFHLHQTYIRTVPLAGRQVRGLVGVGLIVPQHHGHFAVDPHAVFKLPGRCADLDVHVGHGKNHRHIFEFIQVPEFRGLFVAAA